MTLLGDARPPAGSLQQRLEFETLVSELSSRFIHVRAGEVDREIEVALRRVCEALGIDLAVLWQWSDLDAGVAIATHVFAREAVPAPGPLRQEQFPWYVEEMRAGRTVAVASLDALPAQAALDRENGRLLGIQSNLTLPLAVGGHPAIGILALNTLSVARDWPDTLVRRLQLVAQVFTNALARERYELRLQRSEARVEAGADLAGLGFYEVDFDQDVAYIDDCMRALCGIPADRERGLQALAFWMAQLHADDRERVLDQRRQLHDGALDRLSVEYRLLHPTQGERWIHHVARVARRDDSGRTRTSYGVLRDITPNKLAEEALRDLSRRLIRAHEDERALLARELHDDVTQRLAVLAIDVGSAELAAPHGAQAQVMQSIRLQLVRLSEDIHSLAYQLHPSVLEDLGLVEALRAEGERRGRQGRLAVAVAVDPACDAVVAGKEAQLCLFRIAQEALNNVVRHAGTGAASVTLRPSDGGLLLAVRDDGIGFDPSNPRQGRSLGLAGMRERVRLVNGTLDIDSALGRGTTLVAWVPSQACDGRAR